MESLLYFAREIFKAPIAIHLSGIDNLRYLSKVCGSYWWGNGSVLCDRVVLTDGRGNRGEFRHELSPEEVKFEKNP